MAYEKTSGLNVFNHYGPRETGGTIGVERSTDSVHQLSIGFTGDSLAVGEFVAPVVMPAGARVLRYVLVIDEAFTVTGTTPTLRFGSAGSVSTNGVALSETELEAEGAKIPASTGSGTWSTTSATGLTAAAEVAFALGGTTPAIAAGSGKGTLIVEYIYK